MRNSRAKFLFSVWNEKLAGDSEEVTHGQPRILGRDGKPAQRSGTGCGRGPKSAEGKKNSSKNATTHGVLSKRLILPGESQEQFDDVWNGWWTEYEPEGYAEERLVTLLIHNDWFLQRAMRALAEAEAQLFGKEGLEPADWTDAQRAHLQVMQRYKTTAERSFYRSLAAVQGLRRDRVYMLKESTRQERRIRELEREYEELKNHATSDGPAVIAHVGLGRFVGFQQTHEFEPECIDESAPTGIDHVIRNAHCGPATAMVGPFDQHANFRLGTAFAIEHSDLVIG